MKPAVTWLAALPLACLITACAAINPPVTDLQVGSLATELRADVASSGASLELTMDEAVDRAIAFNHSIKAKELETALAHARMLAQSGAMLPSLVAESQYYRRDRPLASHSNSSPTYSTSTDLRTISRDITLSWNILDFGLSYVRAQQGLDKVYQQREELRRVRARIVEDTRTLFWRAVALKKVEVGSSRLRGKIEAALAVSRTAASDPAIDPMISINYQRETLNLQRELNLIEISLAGALDQLKQSIGEPNLPTLRLAAYGQRDHLPTPRTTSMEDVGAALRQRPEIRQLMYDMRITEREVEAAVLQVLPGVTFSKSFSTESNSFLLHSHWIGWGTRIADNLIGVLRLPAELGAVDAQYQLHRQNAVATAATISMQVHVARAKLAVQHRVYHDAQRFAEVQKSLLRQVRASVAVGAAPQQALVREQLASLLAEVRALIAYGDLQGAIAAYATALGDDHIATDPPNASSQVQTRAEPRRAAAPAQANRI